MPIPRIELGTPSLQDWCSTTELNGLPHINYNNRFIFKYLQRNLK